jgi:hypothetical protein
VNTHLNLRNKCDYYLISGLGVKLDHGIPSTMGVVNINPYTVCEASFK